MYIIFGPVSCVHQLHGEDVDGIIRLAYRRHDPTDKPAVQTLLDVLRE